MCFAQNRFPELVPAGCPHPLSLVSLLFAGSPLLCVVVSLLFAAFLACLAPNRVARFGARISFLLFLYCGGCPLLPFAVSIFQERKWL